MPLKQILHGGKVIVTNRSTRVNHCYFCKVGWWTFKTTCILHHWAFYHRIVLSFHSSQLSTGLSFIWKPCKDCVVVFSHPSNVCLGTLNNKHFNEFKQSYLVAGTFFRLSMVSFLTRTQVLELGPRDALIMHWWCTDDVLMMRWWCTDDALMMPWGCTDDALMMMMWVSRKS